MTTSELQAKTFDFAVRTVKLCQHLESCGAVGRLLGETLFHSANAVATYVEEERDDSPHPRGGRSAADNAWRHARRTEYWLRLLRESGVVAPERLDDLQATARQLVTALQPPPAPPRAATPPRSPLPARTPPGAPSEGPGGIDPERLAEIRKTHPRAFEPWTPDEEKQLRQLHQDNISIEDIAKRLQRQYGAVTARLKKLGLIE